MSKLTLIVVLLLGFSCGSELYVPQSFSAVDYQGFQTFIQAVMQTFEGSQYTMPSTCLSQTVVYQLDHDIVAAFFAISKGQTKAAIESFVDFAQDLATNAGSSCGLEEIPESWTYTIKTNGKWKMINDVVYHHTMFTNDLLGVFQSLLKLEYQQAGTDLGAMLKIFLIPAPLKLASALSSPSAQNFIDGILTGLEVNSAQPGTCYPVLVSTTSSIFNILSDAVNVFTGKSSGIKKIFEDFDVVMKNLEKDQENCDFSPLFVQLDKLYTLAGWQMVLKNYVANGAAVYQSTQVIETCKTDYTACGNAFGTIFKLLIGWGLQ
ncbi:unnamed protein product [Blepharisma stoltei]|uniref:Uncharacterized protein n=1 Tax=Blepharisma stoltei TaxID=1481888 RepID=A0AAU9JLI5_9CILI|nr:unnamed protein product [Blepharisma stoltei]